MNKETQGYFVIRNKFNHKNNENYKCWLAKLTGYSKKYKWQRKFVIPVKFISGGNVKYKFTIPKENGYYEFFEKADENKIHCYLITTVKNLKKADERSIIFKEKREDPFQKLKPRITFC